MAKELDLEPHLIVRTYESARDAITLAKEIEALCSVILFTGRIPYLHAAVAGSLDIRTEYIPHEGTDLFRAIASVLLLPQFAGRLPKVSFDSIDAAQISEAFQELGLAPPQHIIPLESIEGDSIDVAPIADQHHSLFSKGEVELCLTCIDDVYRRLKTLGTPVIRIVHSRIVVREALIRTKLSGDLGRAQASQVAICLLQVQSSKKNATRKVSQRLLTSVGRRYADSLDGRIIRNTPNELVILATRGAVERSLHADVIGPAATMKTEVREHLKLGFGFGSSPSLAEENARRAIEADASRGNVVVSLDERTLTSIELAAPVDVRTQRAQNLRAARKLNISPTLIKRLRLAFHQLDPTNFTANELASVYGVIPRSARRLISTLRERGFLEESGLEKRDKAGRPQIAYKVALNQILDGNDL
ncbi:MAG: hypothetical protein AB7F09_07950 [Parvibaculaceae bacterium]